MILKPTHPIQFSIRKLLLWTVVVAVWCGLWRTILETLPRDPTPNIPLPFVFVTSWFAVVIIARLIWDTNRAAIASVASPLIVFAVSWIFLPPTFLPPISAFGLFAVVAMFGPAVILGFSIVAITEAAVRLVNWADARLETRTDENDQDATISVPAKPIERALFARASFITGILGVMCTGYLVFPFIAIAFGHMAKKRIRQSERQLSGNALASWGLVLGYSYAVVTLVVAVWFVGALIGGR